MSDKQPAKQSPEEVKNQLRSRYNQLTQQAYGLSRQKASIEAQQKELDTQIDVIAQSLGIMDQLEFSVESKPGKAETEK